MGENVGSGNQDQFILLKCSIFFSYVSTKAQKDSVAALNAQAESPSTPEEANQLSDPGYSPRRPRRLSTPETEGNRSDVNHSPTKARRFPRPLSTAGPCFSRTDNRISQHIASTTAQRTPFATKHNALSLTGSPGSSPADVITSPDNVTLAKAYGSILQRPDTLPIHTCARCSTIFPPDATIYPDPQAPHDTAPGFLCRPCFAAQGGSKGNCADCGREVLTVTKEGGFIENAGRVWHKRCFRCNNCHKSIGNAPIVDLYGRPSCSECFNGCLDRKESLRKPLEPLNNMGGMRGKSRESSPALEELSERLGIKRQVSSDTPTRETSTSPSPMRASAASREDESLRFRGSLGGSHSGIPLHQAKTSAPADNSSAPLCPRTGESPTPTESMTPDLFSSSDSISSWAPSTPSNSPRQPLTSNSRDSITPKAKGLLTPLKIMTTGEAKCGRCFQSLFSISGNGKIVTVPADMAGTPTSYHTSCFRCFVCGDVFASNDQGHAMFVKDSRGVCHPEVCLFRVTCFFLNHDSFKCNMVDEYIRPTPPRSALHEAEYSDCFTEQPPRTAPPLSRPFPRFGGSESCPGCRKPVSLMEYGVVPGPQNSRWHSTCLVCGGKGAKLPRPGCGKKLDSAAKTDHDGGVWCRECMVRLMITEIFIQLSYSCIKLLLPMGTCVSPQGSPTRGGLTPSYTGTGTDRFPRPDAGRLFGQVTGNTFGRTDLLARQYTGGVGVLRRGSVSPTRQMTRSVSPTKGLIPVTRHQRPAASWKHRSVDEGRGMFLVKQLTGSGQS
jgi:uncharacterized protein with PIN domain